MAFRRLGSVTQVVASGEVQLFHNRLTHSLKVAQIAGRLAQRLKQRTNPYDLGVLGGLDQDVCEATAIAHDLGHPPFGHIAEQELNKLGGSGVLDGFEGNAQSFRIVTKLAFRDRRQPGLNLTRATLRALLKYPFLQGEVVPPPDEKWGVYRTEREAFQFACSDPPESGRSLEACIMDWADDITYAVHDTEDFVRAGAIPVEQLAAGSKEAGAFLNSAKRRLVGIGKFTDAQCDEAFEFLQTMIPFRKPYSHSFTDQVALQALSSRLISTCIEETQVVDGRWHVPVELRCQIALLKRLTFYYVIEGASLAVLQRGQRRLIQELFKMLTSWADEAMQNPDEETRRLPPGLQYGLVTIASDREAMSIADGDGAALTRRAVRDYIASLTEVQAVKLHEMLGGHAGISVSALESWLRT